MKTVIVYSSIHHENTKKLAEAIAKSGDADLINAVNTEKADLTGYDRIGFASGIYYGKYHKSILEFAEKNLPNGKNIFYMHTAGDPHENQNAAIKAIAESKGCRSLGTYFCRGFDSFGPFKLVGGINKNHPDEKEISDAVTFYQELS